PGLQGPVASGDDDRHCLTPAHRDRDVLDAYRDRIAPDHALMQHLDPCALDKAEFDQAAFELGVGPRRSRAAGIEVLNHAGKAAAGEAQRHLRPRMVVFGHDLYFQSRSSRSSAADTMMLYLRAIINSASCISRRHVENRPTKSSKGNAGVKAGFSP